MKNIHRYVIRYAISLFLHQSHFKNKSKCDIAVTCHLFCKKKERHGRSIVVCYFPVVTYCHTLHVSMTTTQKMKLKSLTSRATKIIDSNVPNDIETTMRVRTCLFVRKCMENKLCNDFNEYFKVANHSKNTRNNKSLLVLPQVKLEFERKAFYFFGAKIYNELPLDIRKEKSYNIFKQRLIQNYF